MSNKPHKCCFVVSQIGHEDSIERVHADWFLEAIVQPAFANFPDFQVERADKLAHPGLIDAQVIHKLLSAEIVVADLTGLNPNVFYEIGIRHMAQKPIIHMHQVGQNIPFDVSLYRSLAFTRSRPKDLIAAQSTLIESIKIILEDGYEVENPVTNVRGRFQLEQHATPEQKILFDQLRGIETRLLDIESRVAPTTKESDPLTNHGPKPRIIDPNYVSPYKVGEMVYHHKFGKGKVVATENAKLTINFKGGEKRVIDSFVTSAEGIFG